MIGLNFSSKWELELMQHVPVRRARKLRKCRAWSLRESLWLGRQVMLFSKLWARISHRMPQQSCSRLIQFYQVTEFKTVFTCVVCVCDFDVIISAIVRPQHMHTVYRVPTHPWKSLKVLESTWIFSPKFKALKVLEKRTGAWKSLHFITQVLENPWIHHDVNSL